MGCSLSPSLHLTPQPLSLSLSLSLSHLPEVYRHHLSLSLVLNLDILVQIEGVAKQKAPISVQIQGGGMDDLLMCGDLFDHFDHIDDLLDFPNDDDIALMNGDMVDPPPPITQPHVDAHPPPPLRLHPNGALNNDDDKLFDNLDITDMEWFSDFIPDPAAINSSSLSYLSPDNNDDNGGGPKTNNNDNTMFRASSPVSVLETNNNLNSNNGGGGSSTSSSSCSANNNHRCRRKRPRTTTFSPRPKFAIPFLLAESTANNTNKKKKKEKENPEPRASSRKCAHCGIEKTPQWRVGPAGPKTLCNACGVRYKSGRLFPEYRPAASPTFIHSLHSNSHKRVVEIRLKAPFPSPESCDLIDYIRTRD